MHFDVIVIGAGAAGMMCAATAGRRGRRVLLVEHSAKLAEKIRISGGGRCNFTNLHCTHANFLSRNPAFCRSALARYGPREFIALVERHGIAWHEKTLGQLFCDDSSRRIIELLRAECARGEVRWAMPCAVERIERREHGFALETAHGGFTCDALVIATGGLSIPQLGATPFGYRLAEQFGLAIVPPRPALVPLTLEPGLLARFGELSGASFEAETRCDGARFRERVLLTHRGLSGPAVLQISSYWQWQEGVRRPIELDLLPEVDVEAWLRGERDSGNRGLAGNLLGQRLPKRFAQQFARLHGAEGPLAQLSNKAIARLAGALRRWTLQPTGTLGYRKAEVTLGGIDTDELSQQTMAARRVPGLYFIGEVVDITGHLGGHNFQWAWSSGYCAGLAA